MKTERERRSYNKGVIKASTDSGVAFICGALAIIVPICISNAISKRRRRK